MVTIKRLFQHVQDTWRLRRAHTLDLMSFTHSSFFDVAPSPRGIGWIFFLVGVYTLSLVSLVMRAGYNWFAIETSQLLAVALIFWPLLMAVAFSVLKKVFKPNQIMVVLYPIYLFIFTIVYIRYEVFHNVGDMLVSPHNFFNLGAWALAENSWLGLTYGSHWYIIIDKLALIFIALTIFLLSLCLYLINPTYAHDPNSRLYTCLLLVLITQLNLTFTAADLFLFFLAFESILIPMILLINLWGSPNRRQANNYLVFYTALGAIPMLLAILYIGHVYESWSLLHLYLWHNWSWTEEQWLWLAFFISFAIKTPMVPFHIWLPKAHVDAPTTGSVILAGLLLKIGLFGFLRISLPLFPEACDFFAPYVSTIASIGVLYASFITLRQIDMKRIIAYSSVAHMNMALVSLMSLNSLGIVSCIYLMLSHGIISSALFLCVGFLYNRFHQRTVAYYSGLATLMPIMSIFFFFFSLANMAFPLTSGFIGEFLCLTGIYSQNTFLGLVNALSMLFTTVYSMLLFGRVFLGEPKNWVLNLMAHVIPQTGPVVEQLFKTEFDENYKPTTHTRPLFSTYDLQVYEFIILLSCTLLALYFGIFPGGLLDWIASSEALRWINF